MKWRREFPDAWNNLAVAALALGDWDSAIEAASQALKDSTYAAPEMARANLGWAYLQRKELQKAWKELHEAVSRAPRFCVGRYRLGKVFFERGDMEQAAETLAGMLDDARCPIQDAFLLGALVSQKRGERERARMLFAQVHPDGATQLHRRAMPALLGADPITTGGHPHTSMEKKSIGQTLRQARESRGAGAGRCGQLDQDSVAGARGARAR